MFFCYIYNKIKRYQYWPDCDKYAPAGECPTGTFPEEGPGEAIGRRPAGLGTWSGFDGELANKPDPGEGCGNIDGEGLTLDANDGGEAMLNEVAGLEPNAWCCRRRKI